MFEDDDNSAPADYSGSGSIEFRMQLSGLGGNIETFQFNIYDNDDNLQATFPSSFEDVPSRLDDIPAGPNKKLTISGFDGQDRIYRKGESQRFNLPTNQTVDLEIVTLISFTTNLTLPTDNQFSNGETINFEWEAVQGAAQYNIRIPSLSNKEESIINENISATEFQIHNFSDLISSPEDQFIDYDMPNSYLRFPDTGQDRSYTDIYGEDFDYDTGEPSYNNFYLSGYIAPHQSPKRYKGIVYCIDSEGNIGLEKIKYFDLMWAMTKDNITGLIWTAQTENGPANNYTNLYTWENSFNFIQELNSKNFGGISTWRMPNIKELASIATDQVNFFIDKNYFKSTPRSNFWSSSSYMNYNDTVWVINFSDGNFESKYQKDPFGDHPVLCVRAVAGTILFENSFILNDDGTISDEASGLMWQQDTAEAIIWEDALNYCEGLILNNDNQWTTDGIPNASGVKYDDWRLPNRNELQSIVDYSTYEPAADLSFFPDTESSPYWSSTSNTTTGGYITNAWVFDFASGSPSHSWKDNEHFIRAVRSITE